MLRGEKTRSYRWLLGLFTCLFLAITLWLSRTRKDEPNLPPELAFLNEYGQPTILEGGHQEVGKGNFRHPIFRWERDSEQAIAHLLKSKLAKAHGWQLRIPGDVTPYSVRASKVVGPSPEDRVELWSFVNDAQGHVTIDFVDHRLNRSQSWFENAQRVLSGLYSKP